jgi:hypothetical protein
VLIDHRGPVEWVFTLLSQITSPPVEHVSLVIFEPTLSNLGAVDWARVDHLLTQQRWANLQRLSVRSICDMPLVAIESIRSRLPILESRGVVPNIPDMLRSV